MKITITNVHVCDPQSAFNGKKCDVQISNGIIEDIRPASRKAPETKHFDAAGAMISPGWFDMRASLGEPGFEHKENLESAAKAAAAGGFTSIACLPATQPVLQSKADIEFIGRRSELLPVHIFPYGAITKNREGNELNELYDMHLAGAAAFTDGNRSLMHAGVLLRALQYARSFGALLMTHAEDANIASGGRMHEGNTSVSLGLKGIPNIAEEVMVARDIELARYIDAALHFSHLSSKGSIDLVRRAKKQGLKITCDVAVANLVFTDTALSDFDSNYKVKPPLRGKADQKALWDGLADATIDCIVSDHQPENPEQKEVEFEYATYGMIQLQTAYSLLNMHAPKGFDNNVLIHALAINPRRILNRQPVSISKGSAAELTVFDPQHKWEYNIANNISRSRNSPVMGLTLTGKAIAIINKDQFIRI